jgi:eukaryotic translation initiation factor 2C
MLQIKGLLMEFYQQNKGLKPERLVMYRDGVSEGQFDMVRTPHVP